MEKAAPPTAKLSTPKIRQKLTQTSKGEEVTGPGDVRGSKFLDAQLDKRFLTKYFGGKK